VSRRPIANIAGERGKPLSLLLSLQSFFSKSRNNPVRNVDIAAASLEEGELFMTVELIGKEKSLERIQKAIQYIAHNQSTDFADAVPDLIGDQRRLGKWILRRDSSIRGFARRLRSKMTLALSALSAVPLSDAPSAPAT